MPKEDKYPYRTVKISNKTHKRLKIAAAVMEKTQEQIVGIAVERYYEAEVKKIAKEL